MKAQLYVVYEIHLRDIERLKVKEWKNPKKAGLSPLTLEKIALKAKILIRVKDGYYVIIKRATHQEDVPS